MKLNGNFSFRVVMHVVLFHAIAGHAGAFSGELPPGEAQSSFDSPHQLTEYCSLPRLLDSEKALAVGSIVYQPFTSSDLAVARRICSADFYDRRDSTPEVLATVLCPKLSSTNPAVVLQELPVGTTRAQYIARECPKISNRAGETIAKFKQSVSCSYTPAILGYPRFARALRSEIELPFTAYRSMDRREHLDFATLAKELAARASGTDALIAQTWRMIYRDDLSPEHSPRRVVLFSEGDSLLFGALVPNLSGDAIYYPANGSTSGDRVANFQVTPAFKNLTRATPISTWGLARSFTAATVQELVLLREMGDLVVLDTLLNQQDRFGNLHYRPYSVRLAGDGSLEWKKDAPADEAGFIRVNRMLLQDNDCGIAKENKMALANGGRGMAFKIAHLHPETYRGIQNLQKLSTRGLLANYLRQDLLFRESDVKSVTSNLANLASLFRGKCLGGTLFLDADVAQYTGATPAISSIAFCKTLDTQ